MRTLLVFGRKTFRITIPEDSRITFGPWSPPKAGEEKYARTAEDRAGTLRIYEKGSTSNILGVFSGVTSFRDVSLIEYEEQVATEEVRTVWKSDVNGYRSEVVGSRSAEWVDPLDLPAITSGEEE